MRCIVRQWTKSWRVGEERGAVWVLEPGGEGRCGIRGGDARRAERGPHPVVRRLGPRTARGGRQDLQGRRRHGGWVRLHPGGPRHLAGPEKAALRSRKEVLGTQALVGRLANPADTRRLSFQETISSGSSPTPFTSVLP